MTAADDVFFVLGAPRCATSTVVSIVNACPALFALYEVEFDKGAEATPRNLELVAHLPEARPLFNAAGDLTKALRGFRELLDRRGFSFAKVGTKLLWLGPDSLAALRGAPAIYCVRDVRTWAVKNRVRQEFYPLRYPDWKTNVAPAIADYVANFIAAHGLERLLATRMEDLIAAPAPEAEKIAQFLDVSGCAGFMKEWWKWTAFPAGHPKAATDWREMHASATSEPKGVDTTAATAGHPLWRDLLPLFEKYYRGPAAGAAEIAADTAEAKRIGRRSPARLEDLYLSYESRSL